MNSFGNRTKVHVSLRLLIVGLIGAVSLQLLQTVTSAQTVGPSWSVTGNLIRARARHTATLLSNGKVLVVGGEDNGGLNVAELYNPITGMWSSTGTLNGYRESQTATLLQNGKVLVAGGVDCTSGPQVCGQLSSAELYDPETGLWSSTGSLNTARNSHTATLLPNGKVMVAGGIIDSEGTVSKSAELYDPGTGTWTITGNLNTPRVSHTETLLHNGQVLVSGGFSTFDPFVSGGGTPTAEVYDSATGFWNTTGSMSSPRGFHTSTLLQDGRVLVAGGSVDPCFDVDCVAFGNSHTLAGAELWDPATGAWVVTGNLDTSRALMSATLLPSGKVLVTGGLHLDIMVNINSIGVNLISLNIAELYDPASGTWSRTASLNTERFSHTSTLLSTGKVLAAGGIDHQNEFSKSAELFGVGTDPPNLVDDPQFFVRQQYLDFLNREPESDGLNAWLSVLNSCPDVHNDPNCDRVTVSAAFFESQEFQLKSLFVFHFYKLALGRLPTYAEIVSDSGSLNGQTPAEVYANKATFANAFTERSEFVTEFGALSNADFVTALMSRYQLDHITTPSPTDPDGPTQMTLTQADLLLKLDSHLLTRAQVLRAIADSEQVFQLENNRGFVAMQYYGYLRRTPEQAGYQAWLAYLESHPTDTRTMVHGFMDSIEYRSRFGAP